MSSHDPSCRRLVLLADDLTGAAECAAAFAPHRDTQVLLRAEAPWPDTHVVAIDTDTRHASETDAAACVAAAVQRARDEGIPVVKKIDSTLRGNIGVEVRTALGVLQDPQDSGGPLALVAAGYPAVGRTTLGAQVHVHGTPARTTPFAGDLAALLRAADLRVGTVPLRVVRDPDLLRASIERAVHDHLSALVLDSDSDEDLASIAHAIAAARRPLLVVGSAGIVRAMAGRSRPPGAGDPATPAALGQPALFVLGSYSVPAQRQRLALVRDGAHPVMLSPAQAWPDSAVLDEVSTTLRAGRSVVLSPDPDEPVEASAATAVVTRLASVAAAVLDDVRTLVATGGETARAVMLAAGIETLMVLGEREPGVVGLRAPERHLDIVTKAGAFGDPAALSRVIWPATSKET